MKKITTLTIASMLAGVAGLHAQAFTNPSGYVTHTLKAGQFNLIGLTLHEPIAVSGAFETVSGTTLTDDDVDFDSVLTDGTTYILEITSGALSGTIQEVVWNSPSATNNIVTSDNLGSDGLVAADTYQIRAAATLASIFGVDNSLDLPSAAAPASSAIVWVQDVNANNGFSRYYYNSGGFGVSAEWRLLGESETSANSESVVISYSDAIFVQMPSGSDQDVVFTGAVKTVATTYALTDTFNYISASFPVGSTIQNSGILDTIQVGASVAAADIIWIPQDDGSYNRYYFNTGGFGIAAGLKQILESSEVSAPDNIELTSGIIIQKNGDSVNTTITPGFNL